MKMGMRSLREDGWKKITEGQTTIAEVARLTQEDVYGSDESDTLSSE